jgi:hypothetical protein
MLARLACTAPLILAVVSTGCAHQHGRIGKTRVMLTGYVARTTGGELGLVDLHDVSVANRNLARKVRLFDKIKTRHMVRLEVEQPPDADFTAVLGPRGGNDKNFAVGKVVNGDACMWLDVGWVYVFRKDPCVVTHWFVGGAEASGIFAQVREDDPTPVHRFFFVDGSKACVTAGTNIKEWDEPRTHVDVDSRRNISEPRRESELDPNRAEDAVVIDTWKFIDALIAAGV